MAKPVTVDDFRREIIDFDSEASEGAAFAAFAAGSTGLSRFQDIPWPAGLAPKPASSIADAPGAPLPRGDVLVVTWTVDEGHALSRVFTPGLDSQKDWKHYTHNFATLSAKFRNGCPAQTLGRLGTYWVTTINGKKVVCFKSDSHLSQDGPQMPNFDVWRQLIAEVQPKLVITTGTGGGIGSEWEVGDVIVSPIVHFDCIKKFAKQAFAKESYTAPGSFKQTRFTQALALFKANAAQLPNTNTRKIPQISVSKTVATSIVTTDFFGFDTVQNTFKLHSVAPSRIDSSKP